MAIIKGLFGKDDFYLKETLLTGDFGVSPVNKQEDLIALCC